MIQEKGQSVELRVELKSEAMFVTWLVRQRIGIIGSVPIDNPSKTVSNGTVALKVGLRKFRLEPSSKNKNATGLYRKC